MTDGNINFQICLRYFLSFKGTVFVISSDPLSLKSLPSLQWYPLHIFTINNMKIIVVFLHIILKQKGVFSIHYSQAEGCIFYTLFSIRRVYFLHIILKQKGVFSIHYSQAEGRIFYTLLSSSRAYFLHIILK